MNSKLKQADKLWGKVIHGLNSSCAVCGSYGGLHAHHIIHKTHHLMRHQVFNGILLCFVCHDWAHRHPKSFDNWLFAHRPDQYNWTQQHKHDTGRPDYDLAIRELLKT